MRRAGARRQAQCARGVDSAGLGRRLVGCAAADLSSRVGSGSTFGIASATDASRSAFISASVLRLIGGGWSCRRRLGLDLTGGGWFAARVVPFGGGWVLLGGTGSGPTSLFSARSLLACCSSDITNAPS